MFLILKVSLATNLDNIPVCVAKYAFVKIMSGGKDSSMKKGRQFHVLSVDMKPPRQKISACQVSFRLPGLQRKIFSLILDVFLLLEIKPH